MDWWQIVLIVLIAIVVGLLAGSLISYLITRFQKKPIFEKREAAVVVEGKKEPFSKKRETAAGVKEQLKPTAPNLLAEVENNLRIATEPWTGQLLPFQIDVWDTNQDIVHRLTANLREELTQAYVDMRQANRIVWFSTELGHRSQYLDENYTKLCTNIATRLDRITPLLKESGN